MTLSDNSKTYPPALTQYYWSVAREQIDLKPEEEQPLLLRLSRLRKKRSRLVLQTPQCWAQLFKLLDQKMEDQESLGPWAKDFNNRRQKGSVVAKRVEQWLMRARKASANKKRHLIPRYLAQAKLNHEIIQDLMELAIKHRWADWKELERLNEKILAIEQTLVRSALKLTYKIANEYFNRSSSSRNELEDMIGQANMALVAAVRGYDPDYRPSGRPLRFNTYAYWLVRSAVRQWVMERTRFIHLPKARISRLMTLSRIMATEETSQIEEVVDRFNEELQAQGDTKATDLMTIEEATNLLMVNAPMTPLDPYAGDDHGVSTLPAGQNQLEVEDAKRAVHAAVSNSLDLIEQRIINLKYFEGVDSLAEVHDILSSQGYLVSLKEVEQLEQRALAKLREQKTLKELNNEDLNED